MRRHFAICAILLAVCSCSSSSTPALTVEDSAMTDTGLDVGVLADGRLAPEGTPGQDSLDPLACTSGELTCINGKLAECDPKFGWLIESCPEGTVCLEGECLSSACKPLSARCEEDGVQVCAPDGFGWSAVMPCPDDTICQEGVCVQMDCEPGETACGGDKVLVCAEDGMTWEAQECDEDQLCFDGQCIECVKDADCDQGLSCENGLCLVPELSILTNSLPDGKLSDAYDFQIEAEGGLPPYAWTLTAGTLPQGLDLADDGLLSGEPVDDGDFTITVQVEDVEPTTATKEFSFTVFGVATDLLITTGSPLPKGEEGTSYEVALKASGGEPPYFWGVAGGALPAGLSLGSNGVISGVPADHGTFTFKVKVFDNAETTSSGSKEFQLTIEIAPLVIIGDQEFDLWITKAIILPMVTTLELIPIPYSTQLKAKGGVKPYKWEETELPGFVSYLIPNHGIPEGLTLDPDGKLHGAVTDPNQAISVSIPFTGINLSGYFFMAKVSDSQSPADSASALYLAPTVPIGF